MPDLSQYLSLADLQPFFDDPSSHNGVSNEWRDRYQDRLASIVEPRLALFFKALKTEGRVTAIPHSLNYRCRLWSAWNNFAATESLSPDEGEDALATVTHMFAHRLVFDIVYPYEKVLEEEGAEAAQAFDKTKAYLEKVAEFNQGNFPSYTFSHQNCQETNLPLLLGFANWVPRGYYIVRGEIRPLVPQMPAVLQETVVELKTGNLLVNDWFRIPEFTQAVAFDFPLNSRKGQEDQTRFYAEQFGFISVGVGNSCAGVYQRGNTLVCGYHDEDEGVPFIFHGHVCTDLWAATFIEYENLVDIVAKVCSREEAVAKVDSYLSGEEAADYGIMQITVEPGTYYLYHFGNHWEFKAKAQEAGVLPDTCIDEPYFILSKERLLTTVTD